MEICRTLYWRFYHTCKSLLPCCDRISNTILSSCQRIESPIQSRSPWNHSWSRVSACLNNLVMCFDTLPLLGLNSTELHTFDILPNWLKMNFLKKVSGWDRHVQHRQAYRTNNYCNYYYDYNIPYYRNAYYNPMIYTQRYHAPQAYTPNYCANRNISTWNEAPLIKRSSPHKKRRIFRGIALVGVSIVTCTCQKRDRIVEGECLNVISKSILGLYYGNVYKHC
jgi:hypothetical protein